VFHHSSAAIAAIATTHTLKLPALTIILPLGEGAGLVSSAALHDASRLAIGEECAMNSGTESEIVMQG